MCIKNEEFCIKNDEFCSDLAGPVNLSAHVAAVLRSDPHPPKDLLNESLDVVYRYEAAATEQYYLTVLDVITILMQVHESSQNLENLAANICRVLVCILTRRKLPLAAGFEALGCLDHYLGVFAETTLAPDFSAGAELSHCLLLVCSTSGRKFRLFRQHAALVLFHYVQVSLVVLARVSFPVLTGHLTRGLADLCNKLNNDNDLRNSIHLLVELAKQDSDGAVDTHKQVANLSDTMIKILSASARLRDMEGGDAPAKVELYEEVSFQRKNPDFLF